MKLNLLLLLSALFLIGACRKDIDELNIERREDAPRVLIEQTIRGRVVDEAGVPIANASVRVENEIIQSDMNGYFLFKNIRVNKSGTTVHANIETYFEGISHSNFSAERSSFVEIRMLKKTNPQVVDSREDHNWTTSEGLRIYLTANALVLPNGNDYNGPVNVYSRWLDPTAATIGGTMPGALIATDDNDRPLALASFGMAVIELETTDGTPLELKPNTKLELDIPIPEEAFIDAPNEIDLWFFDVTASEWLLEGTCNKLDGRYKAFISRTGYWNCDVALPAVCLSATIYNNDSTYAAYLKVIVEDLTNNFVYWGYTDSLGYFCGSVPQAAPLRLSIEDHCENIVYTADIGPFSNDIHLDDIYLTETISTFQISIDGMIEACSSGNPVTGHLAVRIPGALNIYPFDNGNINTDIAFKCTSFPELHISAYSTSETMRTNELLYTDPTTIDLGVLATCELLSDYFNLTVEGSDFWTAPTQFYFPQNVDTNWLTLEGLSAAGHFLLHLRDYQGIGIYNSNVFFQTESKKRCFGFSLAKLDYNLFLIGF
ncbi:MAG: carboxypeptidase-like regulatory domain-containing protein [Bacteroidota bacterium]